MHLKSAIILITFITAVSAQTNLSGSIGGMILTREGNPFVVSEDVVIPSGKTVTIREGCIVLFQPFTGIVVDGSLTVEGTMENPVIFTSVRDTVYGTQRDKTPEPFDWNGIHLKQRSRNVHMSHFMLIYSVYGIKSQIEDVVVSHGVFANNGQYHFTINDIIQPVTDNLPYSWNDGIKTDSLVLKKANVSSPWRRPAAIAAMVAGVAGGGGVLGYSLYREHEFYNLYHQDDNTPDEFDMYYERQQDWRNYAVISGAAGGAVLVGGAALFVLDYFWGKRATVSIVPCFGRETGICLTVPLYRRDRLQKNEHLRSVDYETITGYRVDYE